MTFLLLNVSLAFVCLNEIRKKLTKIAKIKKNKENLQEFVSKTFPATNRNLLQVFEFSSQPF